MIARQSLATALDDLARKGVRKVLVTGVASGDGKSGVCADAGRAMASAGGRSIVLVDADSLRPKLHASFGLPPGRGLVELLEQVYMVDLSRETPEQFGIGDWIEILLAQGRTGALTVTGEGTGYSIRIVRGAACSISCLEHANGSRLGDALVRRRRVTTTQLEDAVEVQQQIGRPLGEVLRTLGYVRTRDVADALKSQFAHRLAKIISMERPTCRFEEMADPHLPAAAGRPAESAGEDTVGQVVGGRARLFLRHPFLSCQIAAFLTDTGLPSLKLLTAGLRPRDLEAPPLLTGFGLLIDRLGDAFEMVVVDAPPLSRAGPTLALARHADGVLVVVNAEHADVTGIRGGVAELRRAGGNVLGIVLTREPADGAPRSSGQNGAAGGRAAPGAQRFARAVTS